MSNPSKLNELTSNTLIEKGRYCLFGLIGACMYVIYSVFASSSDELETLKRNEMTLMWDPYGNDSARLRALTGWETNNYVEQKKSGEESNVTHYEPRQCCADLPNHQN